MQLYIGNKNYSSWSMRPWVLMRESGIAFDEVMLRFDALTLESKFKTALAGLTPAGRVPVLVDAGLAVWDTLAIVEYLAECHPDKSLWPADRQARARARSVCAEMHSGFSALRNAFPMNIEAHLPELGARVLGEQPEAQADLARIVQMWTELLAASGGPMLFGRFGIADAYFAPVVTRLATYELPAPKVIASYMARVLALQSVQAWVAEALAEHDFVKFDEPYRPRPP